MKRMLFAIFCLCAFVFSVSVEGSIRRATSKEQIEISYKEGLAKCKNEELKKNLDALKIFAEKYLTIEVNKVPYDSFKSDFYSICSGLNVKKKLMQDLFAQTIFMANPQKYGIYLNDLMKDEEFHYSNSYVFHHIVMKDPSKTLELIPITTLRKIAIELGRDENYDNALRGVELIKIASDKMSDEEIIQDLKKIKRTLYLKIG